MLDRRIAMMYSVYCPSNTQMDSYYVFGILSPEYRRLSFDALKGVSFWDTIRGTP